MSKMRVLVANEPRSYRETMSAAFQYLRPDLEVIDIEPDSLDVEVARLEPHLVVCSRLTDTVERRPAWVVLYPDHQRVSIVSVAGQHSTVPDMEFDYLLSIIDRLDHLARAS